MDNELAFSIGQVASLTGLTPHTIRKWEQRYQIVEPGRSPGGDRRYQNADVNRLRLLKSLVDAGHSIGRLADLNAPQLQSLTLSLPANNRAIRVRSLGDLTNNVLEQIPEVQLVSAEDSDDPVDILIVEKSILDSSIFRELDSLRAKYTVMRIVIVYGFASSQTAARLSNDTTACVRLPVNQRELQRVILALAAQRPVAPTGDTSQQPQPHRYSNEVLARVASHATSIGCECPRHIAEILVALSGFEHYSANCLSRNPADAQIHDMLFHTAARARESFEEALDQVARHDNIPIDQWRQSVQAEGNRSVVVSNSDGGN